MLELELYLQFKEDTRLGFLSVHKGTYVGWKVPVYEEKDAMWFKIKACESEIAGKSFTTDAIGEITTSKLITIFIEDGGVNWLHRIAPRSLQIKAVMK